MLERVLRKMICTGALIALAISPAVATSIDDVRLYADCEGYTVYVEGSLFEPDDVLPVTYRFELEALTPGNANVVVTGVVDVVCDPFVTEDGNSTCSPSVSEHVSWTEALGHPLPCGDYQLITTDAGSCGTIRTRWEWTSPSSGQQCNKLFPTGLDGSGGYPDWDGFLSCPCEPGEEICRSPGFWGTHSGDEKRRSENIAQATLDAALVDVEVCGAPIDTTMLHSSTSALEAVCVSPRGDQRLQLARQLTAAALNCVFTNGNGDCFDVSIGEDFAACNDACAWEEEGQYSACIDALDCFNNGGRLLDDGFCQLGTCASDGSPCDSDESCGYADDGSEIECLPLEGNCHDRPLVNEELGLDFDPPGPAGSPRLCNEARKNDCTLFGDCGYEDDHDDEGRGHGKGPGNGKGPGKNRD